MHQYRSILSRLPGALAALLTIAAAAHGQGRPDFSGEWTRVDSGTEQRSVAAVGDAAFRTGNMGSGWGSPLALRQEGNRLVVEYTHFATYDLQPKLTLAFALDGTESQNTVMIGHAGSGLRSRASWRDSTLVITTLYPGPRGDTEVRHALTLASPASLILETSRVPPGAEIVIVVRTLYRKR